VGEQGGGPANRGRWLSKVKGDRGRARLGEWGRGSAGPTVSKVESGRGGGRARCMASEAEGERGSGRVRQRASGVGQARLRAARRMAGEAEGD